MTIHFSLANFLASHLKSFISTRPYANSHRAKPFIYTTQRGRKKMCANILRAKVEPTRANKLTEGQEKMRIFFLFSGSAVKVLDRKRSGCTKNADFSFEFGPVNNIFSEASKNATRNKTAAARKLLLNQFSTENFLLFCTPTPLPLQRSPTWKIIQRILSEISRRRCVRTMYPVSGKHITMETVCTLIVDQLWFSNVFGMHAVNANNSSFIRALLNSI